MLDALKRLLGARSRTPAVSLEIVGEARLEVRHGDPNLFTRKPAQVVQDGDRLEVYRCRATGALFLKLPGEGDRG